MDRIYAAGGSRHRSESLVDRVHQILIAAAYQKAWGKYLDGDDFVEYSWPPTASLTTEGYVIEPEFGCDHQGEECPASEECLSAPGHIEPAQWDWRVRVDTTRGIDSDHATDDSGYFWFMSTLMDPRAVDYES